MRKFIIFVLLLLVNFQAYAQSINLKLLNVETGVDLGTLTENIKISNPEIGLARLNIVALPQTLEEIKRIDFRLFRKGRSYRRKNKLAPFAVFRHSRSSSTTGVIINGRKLRGKILPSGRYVLDYRITDKNEKISSKRISFTLEKGSSTHPPSQEINIIKVSSNKRFFEYANGQPFFYLGDTAWRLFLALNRQDIEVYLENRRERGFNVIQAVALSEIGDCGKRPNAQGDVPLNNNNPATPNTTSGNNPNNPIEYDYWDHVDYVISTAASKGIYIGLLPAWAEYVNNCGNMLNESNAYNFGKFLGARYSKFDNIIWILGGDRNPSNNSHFNTWRELAKGIQESVNKEVLMTYHPIGGSTSSTFFNTDNWLDFNMWQSGHFDYDTPNHRMIFSDYNKTPIRPVLDGEPNYEDHPLQSDKNRWFRDHDTRKAAYRAVFAGAAGHTYGHHSIWQFCNSTPNCPGSPVGPDRNWKEAILRPGGSQVQYIKKLMLSRPYFNRIPDSEMIINNPAEGSNHKDATRSDDGSYAFIYIAENETFKLNLSKLAGATLQTWWYNPRTGESTISESFSKINEKSFTTPQGGPDWVLIIDDSSKNFNKP
jgi:hypothetical protein